MRCGLDRGESTFRTGTPPKGVPRGITIE
jgi:hypothetical protein